MEILCTASEYIEKLKEIEENYTTYYAWGAFGAPANKKNRTRYQVPDADPKDFLFDCSGFAYKAIPWGWDADRSRVYGGAAYKKSPYESLETSNILAQCTDVSKDFSNILPGEVLYMSGHVGIYIGEGRAIECTSKWKNCVMYSEVSNTKIDTGLPYKREWLKHGKLPFLSYTEGTTVVKNEYIYYKIKVGDNLSKIAKKFGTSIWKIAKANGILNINLIRAGKTIKIPQ